MNVADLLNDKTLKPKEKTIALSNMLIDRSISTEALIAFADTAKDPAKASSIEALELATRHDPAIAGKNGFLFVTNALTSKAPRVKWESARVIGNTAHLFSDTLSDTIDHLLVNTSHEGTVVRWSAAFALGEIVKLKTRHNKDLIPAIEEICRNEEKNSIRKIYLTAIKKINK